MSKVPNLWKKNNEYTKDDVDIAETLAEQYNSAFTIEDTSNLPQIPSKPITKDKLTTFKVEVEQVKKLLKDLIPTKAPGVDKINPRILKEAAEQLALPITLLAKKSIEEGKLP